MNFLAHLYVGTLDEDFLTGGFVADGVKGRAIDLLPETARQGVVIHRLLDEFTDHHPVFKSACDLIRPELGRWSGIVTDILFDHFLASKWASFSTITLHVFAQRCYDVIQQRQKWLPLTSQKILPYIVHDDWLSNYASNEFLKRVFAGMHRRTSLKSTMPLAVATLTRHEQQLALLFDQFFPQAIIFVRQQILQLSPLPALDFSHQLNTFNSNSLVHE